MLVIDSKGEKKITVSSLVPDLLDVKKTAFCTNVRFTQILDPVYDRGADSKSDSVVVRFAHPSKSRHIVPL